MEDRTDSAQAREPGRAVWAEVLTVYAAVAAATVALDRVTRLPPLSDYTHLAIAALFLTVAVQLAQRRPGGLAAYGLALGGLLEPARPAAHGVGPLRDLWQSLRGALPLAARETGVALGLAALIFPPFVLGFYAFHRPMVPFSFHLPDDLFNYVMAQLVMVGLPEEALFRGYFQTRLQDRYPARARLLGARVSWPALVIQALLFAALHVAVDLNVLRMSVFFPGLLFGWLRDLRGGIGAAIVLHALSNLLSDILVRGWL